MKAVSVRPVSVDGDGHQVVDVLLVSDTIPNPLPTTGAGIVGLGDNYVFAPFSILYVVNDVTTKLYIADESGHFVAQ